MWNAIFKIHFFNSIRFPELLNYLIIKVAQNDDLIKTIKNRRKKNTFTCKGDQDKQESSKTCHFSQFVNLKFKLIVWFEWE